MTILQNEREYYKNIINDLINRLKTKKCPKCNSQVAWHSRAAMQVKCKWESCRYVYSLFINTPFTSNMDDNIKKLFIYKNWLEGAKMSEFTRKTENDRHKVFKVF
ncbi:hypothetical protein DMUE_3934 [Dictyocoela muelleri]|nr:hypothetical protein DMUE_3934 [Dictyocoela muelleri]